MFYCGEELCDFILSWSLNSLGGAIFIVFIRKARFSRVMASINVEDIRIFAFLVSKKQKLPFVKPELRGYQSNDIGYYFIQCWK